MSPRSDFILLFIPSTIELSGYRGRDIQGLGMECFQKEIDEMLEEFSKLYAQISDNDGSTIPEMRMLRRLIFREDGSHHDYFIPPTQEIAAVSLLKRQVHPVFVDSIIRWRNRNEGRRLYIRAPWQIIVKPGDHLALPTGQIPVYNSKYVGDVLPPFQSCLCDGDSGHLLWQANQGRSAYLDMTALSPTMMHQLFGMIYDRFNSGSRMSFLKRLIEPSFRSVGFAEANIKEIVRYRNELFEVFRAQRDRVLSDLVAQRRSGRDEHSAERKTHPPQR